MLGCLVWKIEHTCIPWHRKDFRTEIKPGHHSQSLKSWNRQPFATIMSKVIKLMVRLRKSHHWTCKAAWWIGDLKRKWKCWSKQWFHWQTFIEVITGGQTSCPHVPVASDSSIHVNPATVSLDGSWFCDSVLNEHLQSSWSNSPMPWQDGSIQRSSLISGFAWWNQGNKGSKFCTSPTAVLHALMSAWVKWIHDADKNCLQTKPHENMFHFQGQFP